MLEEKRSNKILWIHIKSTIRKELLSRKLKDPKIRLRALENIEDFLRSYYNKEYQNPIELLNIPINTFKIRLGHYKNNAVLNSAEKSIINNIYEYLNAYVTDDNQSNDPNNEEESGENNPAEMESSEHISSEQKFSFNTYEKELGILKELFGEDYVRNKLDRIEEIYNTSEDLWEEQLISLPEDGIKYLLIAEAPPWSSEGEVTYVYNSKSKPRTLLRAISKAFFDGNIFNNENNEEQLKLLTNQGLLIIDSLPFAMDYSNKRGRTKYEELVVSAVKTYFVPKLNRIDIKWSVDLKIGFAFKVNGLKVMKALNNELRINSITKSFKLNNNMIVANDAGYPDANNIKQVFGL